MNRLMMSSLRRIFSSPFMPKKPANFLVFARNLPLKSCPCKVSSSLPYDERNMALGRPLAPHLTIYAPQITSMLSITHRMTGIALAGYVMIFSFATLVTPHSLSYYLDQLEELKIGDIPLYLAKFIIAFPFAYHLCNGIRHLCWDLGYGFTIKQFTTSGIIMVICALIIATSLTGSNLLETMLS